MYAAMLLSCSAGSGVKSRTPDAGGDGATASGSHSPSDAGLDALATAPAADGGGDACGSACAAACDGGQCAKPHCTAACTSGCVQGCFDLGACKSVGAGTLALHPNVYTLGVLFSLANAPSEAKLFYRAAGDSTWYQGPALVRIPDGRLAGSAFGLSADTSYELRVEAGSGAVACGAAITQAKTPKNAPTTQLWVDAAAAAGGDGSSAKPLRTLSAALASAGAGVQVHVRAGVYRESVTLTQGGQPGRYLRIVGEPGAVLDGSAAAPTLTWKDEGGGVYSAAWAGDPRYLLRDGKREYHYLALADLRNAVGKNAEPIAEGFFVDTGRLYVHSAAAPAGHAWQVPTLNTAIQISGAQHVWIEGLEIRFYGEGDYAKGIDITDAASDIVVRNNHIYDIPTPVWVRKGSSAVRIEDNEIHQSSVFGWPWDAVKATDHENDAITLAGGEGAIVARNFLHDVFNGVYAGSFDDDHNPLLAFDVDVYDNRLTRIGDDGFEPEGADINARFWHNTVDLMHNGASFAPITYGPVWVVRNRFTGYQESGFKVSNDTSGRVWLLHNTCFTDDPQHNGMNVSGPFENLVFRNNLIRGTSYAIESAQSVTTDDLDYDALFTTRGAPRVKWNNVRYDDLAALCTATKLECHGVGGDPALLDPAAGRFGPSAKSPLVDSALRLYGINDDFRGAGPDIGYVEQGDSEPALP